MSKLTRVTRSQDCLFWTYNLPRCQVPSYISLQDTCVQSGPLKNYKSNVILGTHDSPYCFRGWHVGDTTFLPSPYGNMRFSKYMVTKMGLRHPQPFLTITAITAHNWLAASYGKPWTLRPQDPAKRWWHRGETSKYHYSCPFHSYER